MSLIPPIWSSFLSLVSGAGYRSKGLQSGRPSRYNKRSASPVTLDTALQLSTVWACAKLTAETIASLPIYVYDVDPKTGVKTLNVNHPLAILFNSKINRWQTRQEYFETLGYQNVLMGNDFSVIVRNKSGGIIGLIPLMSEQMQVSLQDDGSVIYKYTDGANVTFYASDSIWHNKLFGNGIVGLSVLGYARNTIGISQATEEAVTDIYDNGGKPSGVLTIDRLLTDAQREKIKANFAGVAEGRGDRLLTLEAGMQFKAVALSPQDMELLASRKYNVEDLCRFFGIPSVLVNDTSATTVWGSGIQQIVLGWYKLGLRPYLERYQSSMKFRLLKPSEWSTTCIEFDLSALLKMDLADRIKMYTNGVQGGIMTPNQAREEESWKDLPGGDNLYMQKQMVPIGQLAEINAPAAKNAKTNGGTY